MKNYQITAVLATTENFNTFNLLFWGFFATTLVLWFILTILISIPTDRFFKLTMFLVEHQANYKVNIELLNLAEHVPAKEASS